MLARMRRRVPVLRAWLSVTSVATSLATLAAVEARAEAFCGFYVSGADTKLFADATQVVLMREGTRTVLSMQNDYKGPPAAFALVVPVPVVLAKENVKTLPRDVFDKIDQLGSPRLVEYWEQDPCGAGTSEIGLGNIGGLGFGLSGFGAGGGGRGDLGVKVEAKFTVGEYDVVILGAKDSGGLDQWLREQKYSIPEGAEPYLRPYVQAGSKFFVAKVDPSKVTFEGGRASLSPLRFHYDAETFSLPIRLGLVSSGGTQDLVVSILAKRQRYEAANYPNVTIPTNLDVSETAKGRFGEFYAALFDATLAKTKDAVVTEYAWNTGTCDPCPGPALDGDDLATFGADVLPSGTAGLRSSRGIGGSARAAGPVVRNGRVEVTAGLPTEVVQRIARQNFGRFRLCYEAGLQRNASLAGTVATSFTIDPDGGVQGIDAKGESLADAAMVTCVGRGFGTLTFPKPEGGKPMKVTYRVSFAPPDPNAPAPAPRFGMGGASEFVLTRLHARYTKDALGPDLVFRAAAPIEGGREVRRDGELETGAHPSGLDNFQARYAVRHGWTGPVACKEPARGRWGGPPPGDAGAEPSSARGGGPTPVLARKVAYAPRGALTLASVLGSGALAQVNGALAQANGMGASPDAGARASLDAGASADAGARASLDANAPRSATCAAGGAPAPSSSASISLGVVALVWRARRAWRARDARRREARLAAAS
jgi:hypothetical protein